MTTLDLKVIPKNPGVYIFRDKYDKIIYIGKAKNLKNRVSSYFRNNHKNSIKTQYLVKNISKIDYIIVDNEIESLLLENKLIKKNKPKYNINLKDNKTYAYIKITNEKIPKIISTRIVKKDGIYFGPYTDGTLRREIIKLCVELFQIITPQTYSSKSQLNYQIGLSPSKSLNELNLKQYQEKVNQTIDFLKGKNISKIIKSLEIEMKNLSKDHHFEEALKIKNKIENILNIKERQKVDLIKNFDQDVVVIITDNEKSKIQIFNITRGVIQSKKEFNFDYYEETLLEDFIKMYYSRNSCPKELIVNKEFEESEILEKYLSEFRKAKVQITFPKIGEKKKLINLAIKNIEDSFSKHDILEEIKQKLNLPKKPISIECFDMSNLGKDFLVGGMTRWVDQKEDKDNYRRFEIKSFKGKNDDFAAMKEVVYRRYKGIKDKTQKVEFPDLIILDGGKGQLRAGVESLKELNLKIPIISIAKGSKRDKNEIYILGNTEPIIFDNNSQMMLYLRKIRDSVHNFVITYNRKKREMKFKQDIKS